MSVVETRKLGLESYINMQVGSLKGVEQETNTFSFEVEGEKELQEWEFDYVNSCCHRHDTELVNLRKLLRR